MPPQFFRENWIGMEGPSLANTALLPVKVDTPWASNRGGETGRHIRLLAPR